MGVREEDVISAVKLDDESDETTATIILSSGVSVIVNNYTRGDVEWLVYESSEHALTT